MHGQVDTFQGLANQRGFADLTRSGNGLNEPARFSQSVSKRSYGIALIHLGYSTY